MRAQTPAVVVGRCVGPCLLAVCLVAGLSAQAQPSPAATASDAGDTGDARALYESGMQALQNKAYGVAAERFDASYRAEQIPLVLYNLGVAYDGLGKPQKAVEAYEAYVKYADKKQEGDIVEQVKAETKRLRDGMARFGVRLQPADAQISLDGSSVTPYRGELWVSPGKHWIEIRAINHESYSQVLDVQPGKFTLDVQLRSAQGTPYDVP